MFRLFLEQQGCADHFRFGREADDNSSAPWSWEDLDLLPMVYMAEAFGFLNASPAW